jgi:hypothetical protein
VAWCVGFVDVHCGGLRWKGEWERGMETGCLGEHLTNPTVPDVEDSQASDKLDDELEPKELGKACCLRVID